ncbi:class I SAM-dependent methyltransferase [Streptomyces sp. NBC_01451]|uniref:class I SAM-dependent methyltransferase n=1 Tax=Streptomyces sp. NBC_01451 TaxID=2903872 RepID=UPI002E331BA1|nr:class I SAM-dependent methyltransferase [Streptomyces sp. NBC_01451]
MTLSPSSTAAADSPHAIVDRFHWDWYQRAEPGPELLRDLTDKAVVELGAGSGRQAAYLAHTHQPARVVAVDHDPAQHARGRERFGNISRLDLVHADAATYMAQHPGAFDVAYCVFGALDFTDPHTLLPAIAEGLRPGGLLVFSTLAHHRNGHPPATEPRPAEISTRRPDGTPATMLRWVLDTPVWHKLCDEHGFDTTHTDAIHDPGSANEPPIATSVFRAVRRRTA